MSEDPEKKLINRINELYHKKKSVGLTEAEEKERKELHQEFIKNFRAGFKQDVENLVIIDKNGKEITSEKAKRAQRKKGLRKD
ncbi:MULTISPECIES: DUF896 domain-containing protein [Lactobacillus]|uniref:UPF0291 protein DK873_05990 n=1 Tax=Lactobacillus melliventris TaxID=1218507 RepID=A0A0F4LGR1_9LACO|nr:MULTISPECIES: DUF896 domain-containing protein [Lactobacillus]MCT6847613.1 DUF896 domain-containing protein [Lactobacillus helsingborgensis]KJY56766.1 Uncharacterized protein JF74_11190 [Lactobacillus melliventris]MBC6350315.1 DUF896 domain-containing protein [Lactobacillus melliventris]MBH9989620.1 DUF896 domain-containing protein [Lactobacillus sp. M0392]MBI0023323.1 DUF896 domain-containing protein [Lactobacillus sp. W8171]